MPAVMRLLGWKAFGLRCPDHELSCCSADGTPNPITLVQMPNGTGKTTTLNLIRAGLSGAGLRWDPEQVREFQKKTKPSASGQFQLKLLLNDRRVTIIMDFDFDAGRVRYKTTRHHGQVDGFEPPPEFRRFMNENFVNFYVFDGELAHNLLKKERSDADSVVESLFQVHLLAHMREKVSAFWDRTTEEATATDEKGYSRRTNRLARLRARLKALQDDQSRLLESKDKLESNLQSKMAEFEHEIQKQKDLAERITDAKLNVTTLAQNVDSLAHELLDSMREPNALHYSFAKEIAEFKAGLDRVKLPETAAKEFFVELCEEAECICGRPIDAAVKDAIRRRANQYLGSDDTTLLNAMKSSIDDAVGRDRDEAARVLIQKTEALTAGVNVSQSALNDLDALTLEAEQADPAVKDANEQIAQIKQELADLNDALEEFESPDDSRGDDDTTGIDIIKRRIDDAEKKVAEIAKTTTLKEKRDVLLTILSNAHELARGGIADEICRDANAKITELMPDNNISIDRISRCLVLQGQGGGSVGETLSVAYAFLATLFTRAEHELPFIVDSPAGPIDLAVRPRIGALVPKLSSQFVAFTISSERDRFIPSLKKACQSEIEFITLFRNSGRAAGEVGRVKDSVESGDGILVRGDKFFSEFQVEAEDENGISHTT